MHPPPPIRRFIALAIIGLGAVLPGGRADALDVAATFTIVQQPPVVALSGPAGIDYAATFPAGGGPVALVAATGLTVTDLFVGRLASAQVTITNPLDGAEELLAATAVGAITAGYAPGSSVLTLSGVDSLANYQRVLRSLTYQDRAIAPDMTARSITVVVSDGTLGSPPAISTVTLVASPTQPPSGTGNGGSSHHCGLGAGFGVAIGLLVLLLRGLAGAALAAPRPPTRPGT